jgi:hypothetical protein
MILIWRTDTSPAVWTNGYVRNYFDLCDLGLKANLCLPAPRPFPPTTLVIETDAQPADYICAGPIFVVSERLRAVFDEFGVPAEYFKLNVLHHNDEYLVS